MATVGTVPAAILVTKALILPRNWGHQPPPIGFQTQRNWMEQHLLEPTQNRPTHYEVLGVHVRTDASTIRTAYLRRVARMRNVGDRPFSCHGFDRTFDRHEMAGTAPRSNHRPGMAGSAPTEQPQTRADNNSMADSTCLYFRILGVLGP